MARIATVGSSYDLSMYSPAVRRRFINRWIIIHLLVDYPPPFRPSRQASRRGGPASATLGDHDARGLRELADAVGKNWLRGVILYTGREIVPFASNLRGIPTTALWA